MNYFQDAIALARRAVWKMIPEEPEPGHPTRKGALALAWLEEVNAEWDRMALRWPHQDLIAKARELAGDYSTQITYGDPGMPPVYAMVGDRPVVCIQGMMGMTRPLWVHHYAVLRAAREMLEPKPNV